MSKFQALSPLGYPQPHQVVVDGFKISEITDRAMASVAARKDGGGDVQKALKNLLKKAAPDAGAFIAGGGMEAIWTGPQQWMLTAPYDSHEDIAAILSPKFKGKASITEQSDGWCRFAVEGDGLDHFASLICNIDMRKLTPGKAVRTVIEHLGCFVLRVDGRVLHILGPRSSAGSLHHALTTAARSASF